MPRCIGLRYKVIAIGHKGLWIIGNKSFVFWWFQVLPRNSCTLGPRKMRLEKNSGYLLHARRTTQCQVCVYSYHRIIHSGYILHARRTAQCQVSPDHPCCCYLISYGVLHPCNDICHTDEEDNSFRCSVKLRLNQLWSLTIYSWTLIFWTLIPCLNIDTLNTMDMSKWVLLDTVDS